MSSGRVFAALQPGQSWYDFDAEWERQMIAIAENHCEVDDIEACVATIREMADRDCETAHMCEAQLFRAVMTATANAHYRGNALCRAALKSCEIEFSRWYA